MLSIKQELYSFLLRATYFKSRLLSAATDNYDRQITSSLLNLRNSQPETIYSYRQKTLRPLRFFPLCSLRLDVILI
jgi:hypothetical protein